jgi:thiosulfate/3-mercaptopyruvate sulfurtransferase
VFAATMAAQGLRPGRPVVVYDAANGMYAARAWWMLRWIGHDNVQVLDGGWAAWLATGGDIEAGILAPTPVDAPHPLPDEPVMQTIGASELLAQPDRFTVIDARAPERYRGETEPLDPVAGHIPGALNHPFTTNLHPDGRFLDAATLRARFDELLGTAPARPVVQQCGSGVTACHNLLAMAVAGRGDTCLYPGSWSEWCSDPVRPVARG